jgi:dTDP-glucose 4,6-dehydratase
MNLLVTGGAGFIGSHFVKALIRDPVYKSSRITILDSLTYAGNLRNLGEVLNHPNVAFVEGDIADYNLPEKIFIGIDAIVNFAAESHVDRSIDSGRKFVETNVLGTQNLLEKSLRFEVKQFLHVSTDEVYGSIAEGSWGEESPLLPNSPYAASKAGSDLLVRAYSETFGLHANVTRCSNNFGTHQYPEKFIPVIIESILLGELIPVYGNGENSRDWLSVHDHCRALLLILAHGKRGEIYNIGGGTELTNLELVKRILGIMGADEKLISYVQDRKGHDKRYSVSYAKLTKDLGYKPLEDFETNLRETIEWYRNNREWWSLADGV